MDMALPLASDEEPRSSVFSCESIKIPQTRLRLRRTSSMCTGDSDDALSGSLGSSTVLSKERSSAAITGECSVSAIERRVQL